MLQRFTRIAIGVGAGMALLGAGIWILIHTLGDRDPQYQGKPLDYWVAQLNSQDGSVSNRAQLVCEKEIIPGLSATMFSDLRDSSLRLSLVEKLNGLPGVMIYFTPADGRRARATSSLGQLGPHARAAIPDLVKALKGEDGAVRSCAAKALGEIQSEPETIIPLLMTYVNDPQDGVPESAIEALGLFGARSKAAVPKLIPMLKIPDKDLHRAVTVALKQIDPEEAGKAGVK